VKEVPKGTTALEVAKSISPQLADAALVATLSTFSLTTVQGSAN
jgi:hypothetical protein